MTIHNSAGKYNATRLHCQIKNQPFSLRSQLNYESVVFVLEKCCRIENCQTSKCRQIVIRQITQTQTEAEDVRSHSAWWRGGGGHIRVDGK